MQYITLIKIKFGYFIVFLFRNALGDGKRAVILKNNWTKVGLFCVIHLCHTIGKNLFTGCTFVCKNAG